MFSVRVGGILMLAVTMMIGPAAASRASEPGPTCSIGSTRVDVIDYHAYGGCAMSVPSEDATVEISGRATGLPGDTWLTVSVYDIDGNLLLSCSDESSGGVDPTAECATAETFSDVNTFVCLADGEVDVEAICHAHPA